jgi:hypothetical protein
VRKLLLLLLVLAALAVAADRASLALAERAVAEQLRASEELATTPSVQLGGFPFLTQVLSGRYDEVRVTAEGLQREGVRVQQLDATLTGVEVRLGDVLAGDVTALPLASLRATALVTYADLARRTGLVGVRVQAVGERLRVTARVTVLGRTYTATAVSALALRGDVLAFAARSASVAGAGVSEAVAALVARALAFRVPVGELPFGLSLDGVQVTREGLRLKASSGPTVLTTR